MAESNCEIGGSIHPRCAPPPNYNGLVLLATTNGSIIIFPYGALEIHEKYLQQTYFQLVKYFSQISLKMTFDVVSNHKGTPPMTQPNLHKLQQILKHFARTSILHSFMRLVYQAQLPTIIVHTSHLFGYNTGRL